MHKNKFHVFLEKNPDVAVYCLINIAVLIFYVVWGHLHDAFMLALSVGIAIVAFGFLAYYFIPTNVNNPLLTCIFSELILVLTSFLLLHHSVGQGEGEGGENTESPWEDDQNGQKDQKGEDQKDQENAFRAGDVFFPAFFSIS